jgi:hypothetical protein
MSQMGRFILRLVITLCFIVVTSNLIGSQRFRWRFRIDQEITNVISQGRYGQCLVTASIPWRGAMYNEYHLGFMKWQSFSKNTKFILITVDLVRKQIQ